jgi:hypothetical protein
LKFRKRNLPCKIILKLLEGDAMNHVSHNLLVGFHRVLTLVFLLLTSLAHAEERPEAKKYQVMAEAPERRND